MRPGRLHVIDGDAGTADVARWEASRRDAVRRGIVVGGAGLIAASAAPLLLRVRDAFAQAEGDAAILASATGMEQVAAFAYQAAVDSELLDAEVTKAAELFRDHEQQHADAHGAALEALGGARPGKPADAAQADKQLRALGLESGMRGLAGQAALVMFAIELETAMVAAYFDAHERLQDAKLLQTTTSIMANEGQHLVVLRQLANRLPVPEAFEAARR